MELLDVTRSLDDLGPDPVLVVALDGWTDAAGGGTGAAETLLTFPRERLGTFPSDALYDYRDRRPELEIDRGRMTSLSWPELVVDLLMPATGPRLLLVHGAEPDLAWQTCASDLIDLARRTGADRYVGLGSVPGPIPHTRPVQMITTGNDETALERHGRAHEQIVVPASCQAAWEAMFDRAGMTTLGLWVRVPHYVAGEYPEASRTLLERFSSHLGTPVDLTAFASSVQENRAKLDVAASSSDEVSEHVRQLEHLYDAEAEAERAIDGLSGTSRPALSEDEVPSAEELGAEIERFLRGRAD
jgi:hypothetical protein